jgi:hypothetical protein
MRLSNLEEELSTLSTDSLEDLRMFLEEPNMLRDLVRAVDTAIRKSREGEDRDFPGPTLM